MCVHDNTLFSMAGHEDELVLTLKEKFGQVVCNSTSYWAPYPKTSDMQSQVFHTLCEEAMLSVFVGYVEKNLGEADYTHAHLMFVYENSGNNIICIEQRCEPEVKKINFAFTSMLRQLAEKEGFEL